MDLMFDYVRKMLTRQAQTSIEKFIADIAVDKVQKFLIDNVYTTIPKILRINEIPNIAPPYAKMWFEWSVPIDPAKGDPYRKLQNGVYVESTKMENGWDVIFLCFTCAGNKLIPLPISLKCIIPSDGHIPEHHMDSAYLVNGSSSYLLPKEQSGMDLFSDKMFIEYVIPIFFTLGLLHCKNIIEVEKGGKNPNVKNRRHRSKGTKHYVLNVIPSRNIKRTEYEQSAKGTQQRLHFRRGHFKEYTTEKPLFGKYVGIFWWEAHAAGSVDVGEIKKDYRILPM